VCAVAVVVAVSTGGAADPVLRPAETAAPGSTAGPGADLPGCADREEAVPFDGFGEVAFQVRGADGATTFDGCAHLADTPETRAQGLMGRRSLGGYDAMVFRFEGPSTGGFFMFRTPLPLSIAFIGADGGVVSTADMDPCPASEGSACPSTFASGPYVHAIEVEQGGLDRRGLVPGATVRFGPGIPPS
jgi:uncharacterized membrane protein (UPF0127 family)